ncbi:unnamed protein product [Prorocentrum cordatum]|uniref:Uncharacterized protein n=1 Tax=Prorocentrum cordatum TaxID=2364126 RepID=A0ABN9WWS1_9DINO|nr:unnamed protein product [Polarella glacialis]
MEMVDPTDTGMGPKVLGKPEPNVPYYYDWGTTEDSGTPIGGAESIQQFEHPQDDWVSESSQHQYDRIIFNQRKSDRAKEIYQKYPKRRGDEPYYGWPWGENMPELEFFPNPT